VDAEQNRTLGKSGPKPEPVDRGPHFTDVTKSWKVDVAHHAGRNPDRWIPEIMNGGVALLDADRNGALDILMADGGALAGQAPEGSGPRLLLGDGRGGFEDVSARWGLTPLGYGMGVAAADVNGDGWVDIYLTTYDGHDRLLLNQGGSKFFDGTAEWKLDPTGWSTSAAFFDIDRDGDLDLYVARYVDFELDNPLKCRFRSIHVYCTPSMYAAAPDRLYRNDGGHFTEISESSGISRRVTKSLALATGDFDDDGDSDLYVAADTSQNLLWINDGSGHFEDEGIVAGVALSRLGREEASMGVSVSDADADGQWDLAVTNFQAEPTSLYTRRERGSYRERSDAAGIGASSRSRLSFGIEWHDADNVASYREQVEFAQLNSLYEHGPPGRFVDISAHAGDALEHRGVSRGLAVGDLDSDGGLDFVVVDNDAGIQVARNTTDARGNYLSLWLEAAGSNRSAIGTQLDFELEGQRIRREVRGSSSYQSVSDRRLHIGLGTSTRVAEILIRWPDGVEQKIGPFEAGLHLHLVQGLEAQVYTPGEKVLAP
jgi:hypothetical protein